MPNRDFEKAWIPVLTEFIEDEINLDRSEWAEAFVRNLFELFNSGWGASHPLTLIWTDYFNTLLSHRLFTSSEQDFRSILRFDI